MDKIKSSISNISDKLSRSLSGYNIIISIVVLIALIIFVGAV